MSTDDTRPDAPDDPPAYEGLNVIDLSQGVAGPTAGPRAGAAATSR